MGMTRRSQPGVNPWPLLTSAALLASLSAAPLLAQPSLQITSPPDGTVIAPGQTFEVVVTPSPGAAFILVAVVSGYPIGDNLASGSPPYQVPVPIAATVTPGRYQLGAVGAVTPGQPVYSAPISIDVERPDNPVSLHAQSSITVVPVGKTDRLIQTVGTFSDGLQIDLTNSTLTTYATNAPAVATVDTTGTVTAVSPGTANITITNGNASTLVQVVVPPAMSVMPKAKKLYASQKQQFTAWGGYDDTVPTTWSVQPAGLGSISASGLYAAPASITSQQTVTIVATNTLDATQSATATLSLYPNVTISVTPPTANLWAAQTQQFQAMAGNARSDVTWSISPTTAGSVDYTGLYTASTSITTIQAVQVTAASAADPTKSSSATVTLYPPISVTVSPAGPNGQGTSICASQTLQFTATVTNAPTVAVTWSLNPALGTIGTNGMYIPPPIPAQLNGTPVTVSATSQADNKTSGSALVILSATCSRGR